MNPTSDISLCGFSADLAWAVPVRADVLRANLEAYSEYKETITALRLCHRFGRGTDVTLTKLPLELELHVEKFIISGFRQPHLDRLMLSYRCFEARCQPIDHWDKIQSSANFADEWAEALEANEACWDCHFDSYPRQCQHGCKERSERYLNEWIRGEANIGAFHGNIKMEWESMYEAGAIGNLKMQFEKLRKLLLRDFGLSIYARLHRKAESHNAPWTDDSHHEWHDVEDLLTIVCYLTTPKKFSTPYWYSVSDFEKEELGVADLAVVDSSFVELPNPADQPKRARQFRLAMSALGLEPYIHPSQLRRTISVNGDTEMLRQGGDGAEKDANVSTASSDVTEAQRAAQSLLGAKLQSWPRVIQTVNASVLLLPDGS